MESLPAVGRIRTIAIRAATVVLAALCALPAQTGVISAGDRILVFTRTEGFRHDSISAGRDLVAAIADAGGLIVEETEEPTDFTAGNLARFAVVVFLNTTGDVLDPLEEAAFRAYIEGGGGWVGVHSATDTEHDWPWYGTLIGGDAWFVSHPAIQDASLDLELLETPSTGCYPASFTMRDEWYNFLNNPRDAMVEGPVEVLMTIDESSYNPGANAMGADHPIAWRHEVGQGRAWYTNLGHRNETYADPGFREHLRGGILWAAGADFADGFESTDLCRWSDTTAN